MMQKNTGFNNPMFINSIYLIRALCFESAPWTLPLQFAQPQQPHGTQKVSLSAAPFPT